MQQPKQSHWMAVVRYVKGSSGLGIFLRKGPTENLEVHCVSTGLDVLIRGDQSQGCFIDFVGIQEATNCKS